MRAKPIAIFLLGAVVGGFSVLPVLGQSTSIIGSGHDLSVTGTGPVMASTTNDVCTFCHTSHGAFPAVPLWNHQLSALNYTPYISSTYVQANPVAVSIRSKLCLSCHDGTVAAGQTVVNSLNPIPMSGTMKAADIIGGAGSLSADHPFGFAMPATDDGEIKTSLTLSPPTTSDPAVKLYRNAVECVSCHEPHDPNRDMAVQFMVESNLNSTLCMACHDTSRGVLAGWSAGAHAQSSNLVTYGSGFLYTSPYTVANNACESCHQDHNAAGSNVAGPGARLLRGADPADCTICHGSAANLTPMPLNIQGELSKSYSHPMVSSSTLHDPGETLPVDTSRHASCPDCHNPHASQPDSGVPTPPLLEPSLAGTSGISATEPATNGIAPKPAINQFEICFKCHANSTNKPQNAAYIAYGATPFRVSQATLPDPYNVRLELQSLITRHNVTQPSRGNVSPSLRTNMLDLNGQPTGRLLPGSGLYLYCTDCHNNDQARINTGGSGPNGPHGSANNHLLERPYTLETAPASAGGANVGPAYSSTTSGPYAMCDKCHDLDGNLLANTSNSLSSLNDSVFHLHYLHVVGGSMASPTACSTCHASHGVQNGSSPNNAHLMDFDTRIVAPDTITGQLSINTSTQQCYLTCHGVDHSGATNGATY